MTDISGKRALPLLPHSDHLRKQAKARLAAMRAKSPGVRLTEVQLVLSREYGFANWGALQAEVARRGDGPRGALARVRRLHMALLPRYHCPIPEAEAETEPHLAFFRAGVIAQIGFILAALVGVSMVLLRIG